MILYFCMTWTFLIIMFYLTCSNCILMISLHRSPRILGAEWWYSRADATSDGPTWKSIFHGTPAGASDNYNPRQLCAQQANFYTLASYSLGLKSHKVKWETGNSILVLAYVLWTSKVPLLIFLMFRTLFICDADPPRLIRLPKLFMIVRLACGCQIINFYVHFIVLSRNWWS